VFAKAVYDPLKPCVDSVLDSSRYFVIRVEDNSRKAYIGIGFAERTDSFDFSQSSIFRHAMHFLKPSQTWHCRIIRSIIAQFLQYIMKLTRYLAYRRFKARLNPPSPTSQEASSHAPTGPKKDYSLKEGQTFSISIPGRNKQDTKSVLETNLLGAGSASSGTGASSGAAVPLLPPPPSAPKRR